MNPRRWLLLLGILALAGGILIQSLRGPGPMIPWPRGERRSQGRGERGQEEGEWTWWYEDGQIRERGRFEDGHRVGVWTQWYPHGQRASDGERIWVPERRASERHGPWTFWSDDGSQRAEGSFDRGLRVGRWSFWMAGEEQDEVVLDPERSGTYEAGVRVGD